MEQNKLIYSNIKASELFDRIDASYYQPKYYNILNILKNCPHEKNQLHNICFVNRGMTPSANDYFNNSEYKIIKSDNLTGSGLKYDEIPYVSNEFWLNNQKKKLSNDAILISSIGLGSTGKADILLEKGNYLTVAEVTYLKAKNANIDMAFLVSYLRTEYGRNLLLREEKGSSGQTHLYPKDLEKVTIILPTKNIQKYIGDKIRMAERLRKDADAAKIEAENVLREALNINELESKINSVISKKWSLVNNSFLTDRIDPFFYQEQFLEVKNHLKNLTTLKVKAIGTVNYGYMPLEDYVTSKNGYPLLRITNIKDHLRLDLSEIKYVPNDQRIKDEFKIKEGDVIVVQCGNTTGKIALANKFLNGFLFPSFCLKISGLKSNVLPGYIALVMNSLVGQKQIWQTVSYTSIRPNTTKPNIENIIIPIIDINIQSQINERIFKYINQLEESKELIRSARRDVEDLIEGNFEIKKEYMNLLN